MEQLEFEIKGKKYSIPEVINIEIYVKIFKIQEILSEDYFQAKLINLVTGCPMEDLLETNHVQIEIICSYILSLIPKVERDFIDRFELDGVHYGFIPYWNKGLTFAEYIDIDTIASKPYEELLDYLHVLAAMYYRPIIKERSHHDFDIEKYTMDGFDQRAELFKKKLNAGIILGAQFFFIKSVKKSSEITDPSLTMSLWDQMKHIWKNRKVLREMMKYLSENDLDGSRSLISYQKTILQDTIKSWKKPWWKRLTNWST